MASWLFRITELQCVAFIPKDEMQRDVHFNDNGLLALFVKEGIAKIVRRGVGGLQR